MTKKPIYLFVWENVLHDWRAGVAYAYASTATEAKNLLIEAGIEKHKWKGVALEGVRPTRHSKPYGNFMAGSA